MSRQAQAILVLTAALTLVAATIVHSDRSERATSIRVRGSTIEFLAGDAVAAKFHTDAANVKPYFWPILAPNGSAVTRGWPMEPAPAGGSMDHIHQNSGWFTYGDVIPDGIDVQPKRKNVEGVDFWAQIPVHGRIACTEIQPASGNRIALTLEWRAPGGQPILTERRTMSFRDLGVGRLIVVDCYLRADGGGVTFGDTKEGAFGVRVNDQLRTDLSKDKPAPPANAITNAKGAIGEKACWGKQADWCDTSGMIDGKPAGIAIFDDPKNEQRACWHVRGYGLMAANPFGRAKSGFPDMVGKTDRVKLAKGERLRLRYGIYAHDGDVKAGNVAEAFARFVQFREPAAQARE